MLYRQVCSATEGPTSSLDKVLCECAIFQKGMVCRQNKWNLNVVKRIVHVYENAITFHECSKRKSNTVCYTESVELVSSELIVSLFSFYWKDRLTLDLVSICLSKISLQFKKKKKRKG